MKKTSLEVAYYWKNVGKERVRGDLCKEDHFDGPWWGREKLSFRLAGEAVSVKIDFFFLPADCANMKLRLVQLCISARHKIAIKSVAQTLNFEQNEKKV